MKQNVVIQNYAWYREVVQKVKMEKTTTTLFMSIQLLVKKLEKEHRQLKVTKMQWMRIVHYGGEKVPQGHKDELIQTHRKVARKFR